MADDRSEDVLEEKDSHTQKLMLIIIILSVLFMVIMGAGFYVLWNKVAPPDPEIGLEQDADEEEAEKNKIRPVFSLNTFVVNLADRGGSRYLRTTLDLELTDETTGNEIKQRLPQIRNAILMIIPTKTSKEIKTTEGKTALRDEIMKRVNSFMKTGSVTNIYFTEFVVQ